MFSWSWRRTTGLMSFVCSMSRVSFPTSSMRRCRRGKSNTPISMHGTWRLLRVVCSRFVFSSERQRTVSICGSAGPEPVQGTTVERMHALRWRLLSRVVSCTRTRRRLPRRDQNSETRPASAAFHKHVAGVDQRPPRATKPVRARGRRRRGVEGSRAPGPPAPSSQAAPMGRGARGRAADRARNCPIGAPGRCYSRAWLTRRGSSTRRYGLRPR
jgi:hypothetical protein